MLISGMVQGVYYRSNTKDKALSLGLKGWVRNLLDGRVEVVAEGEEEQLMQLLDYCRDNPGYSRVEDVQSLLEKPTGEFKDFKVTYMD